MNGRSPILSEKLYIDAVKRTVGCYACWKLGYDNDLPEEYLAVHHNPDKGSREKYCHFFAFTLCAAHHQGVVPPGCNLPDNEPVRHSQLGARERLFRKKIGDDLAICFEIWEMLPVDTLDRIGMATGIHDFSDLVRLDAANRNQTGMTELKKFDPK